MSAVQTLLKVQLQEIRFGEILHKRYASICGSKYLKFGSQI
jgi:hypothetical protein